MGLDFGAGISGGASGAALGSSFLPGWGSAIGGALGFAAGLFGSKKKKAKKPKPYSTLDPQQQELYGQQMAALRGEGPFGNLYNFDEQGYNDVFDQTVGRPAYRNFQENIIPNITGQFRGNNLMNSSYAGQSLSRAGRDVQENLDAQRSANIFQGQQQANQNKMNGINSLLNTQTQAYGQPQERSQGSFDQTLTQLAPIGADFIRDYLKDYRNKPTAPASPTV